MPPSRQTVRFEMERDYIPKALKTQDMRVMLMRKLLLGKALFFARSTKVTGENARAVRTEIGIGGEKLDRLEGRLIADSDHALAREFGRIRSRGGEYTAEVAARYGRKVDGRATKRLKAEAVLGGTSRRRESIAKTLEIS